MRGLMTTQTQEFEREQIQKVMLARLRWRSRYADMFPPTLTNNNTNVTQSHPPSAVPCRTVLPPVTMTTKKKQSGPPPTVTPPPVEVTPIMKPVSPQTRQTLYKDSSHQGGGRSQYLQRRGRMRPEDKFEFPLLSSWEYGWRLGNFSLDYRTPSRARSSVVRNSFYTKNGVFYNPSATDTLG